MDHWHEQVKLSLKALSLELSLALSLELFLDLSLDLSLELSLELSSSLLSSLSVYLLSSLLRHMNILTPWAPVGAKNVIFSDIVTKHSFVVYIYL